MVKCLICLGAAAMLFGCGVPEVSTPAPTPFSIHITYPSDLRPWIEKFAGCASATPGLAVYFTQSPAMEAAGFSDRLRLELGEPADFNPSSYLAQIGNEQVVLIANQLNPRNELTLEQLRDIFSGRQGYWDQVPGQPIQVWVLPPGDPARQLFDSAVIPTQPVAPNAFLAPDAGAMLEAVAKDENSIGYLPASFITTADPSLSGKVKLIQLDETLPERLILPVIAVTEHEPEGLTRQLIICLQEGIP